MTTLTVVVPCYNSADYMGRCINSVLAGGNDIEIIIVDDGSTDKTPEIADRYQRQFPHLVHVIHKANGGHGSAVNAGLSIAKGKYIKIVDSDDWVEPYAYAKILNFLRNAIRREEQIDLVISNFVYQKEGCKTKTRERYANALPTGRPFGWGEVGVFHLWQYMLMHSMIYRTEVLRESGMRLPEHSFYVDNLFAFIPLPFVKTLYYLDVNFYRYFTGRDDQSVNEKVMISRIEQQMLINQDMFKYLSSLRRMEGADPALLRYMAHYLEVTTLVTSTLLIRSRDKRNWQRKDDLWQWMESVDPLLTEYLYSRFFGKLVNLPGRTGNEITILAYKAARAVIGFS